jgi:hypothetical protein
MHVHILAMRRTTAPRSANLSSAAVAASPTCRLPLVVHTTTQRHRVYRIWDLIVFHNPSCWSDPLRRVIARCSPCVLPLRAYRDVPARLRSLPIPRIISERETEQDLLTKQTRNFTQQYGKTDKLRARRTSRVQRKTHTRRKTMARTCSILRKILTSSSITMPFSRSDAPFRGK